MVRIKNSAVKVVAFMLVLALVVSLLAFIMPKQTAQVQAATLDREPGLYEAGTTNQTHTWDEVMAKLYAGKYEGMAGFYFTVTTADDAWFTGDLVMGDFDTTENAALGREVVLEKMFEKCTNLVSVDISKASFPGYVNLCSMCKNATSIKSFNFGSFKVNNISSYMTFLEFFYGCTNLKTVSGSIDFTGLDEEVYTMGEVSAQGGIIASMFENCTSLESMDLTQLLKNTDILNGAYSLFKGCTSLKSVKVGSTLSTVYYLNYSFANYTNLTDVVLEVPNEAVLSYTFQNCTSLESVDFSKVKLIGGTDLKTTFDGMTIKRIILGPEGMVVGGYRNIAAYLPTAPSGAHYAFTDEPATAITEIYSAGCGKTIELFSDADNKSLAPEQETPVVPSTGVVSNTVAIVIVAMSVIALAVVSKKKKVAR